MVVQRSTWDGLIANPLEEDKTELFLASLSDLLSETFLPTAEHVQVLLYLAVSPSSEPHIRDQSIALLRRLSSLHPPSSLTRELPSAASSSTHAADPPWLQWRPVTRATTRRSTYQLMRACAEDGVWGLFRPLPSRKGKEREGVKREEVEDEQKVAMTEQAWDLLEWFLCLWEADEKEAGKGWSPAFVEQLPRPYAKGGLKIDDCSAPLSVVRAALTTESTGQAGRVRLAARLVALLFHTAVPPGAPFHPPSLLISLLHILRTTPLLPLKVMSVTLTPLVPWEALSNLYTYAIEDLAGIRPAKAVKRRDGHLDDFDRASQSSFPAPTVAYTLEILRLHLGAGDGDVEERTARLADFKFGLLALMLANRSPSVPSHRPLWSGATIFWSDSVGASASAGAAGSRSLMGLVDLTVKQATTQEGARVPSAYTHM